MRRVMIERVRQIQPIQAAWIAMALLGIGLGLRFLATEPGILEPGGWFALDGRRLIEAARAWLDGQSPYSIEGFLYSPVAIVLATPWTLMPDALAIVLWVVTSAVAVASVTMRHLSTVGAWWRSLAALAVLMFIPTIADLVLANVTIALIVAVALAIRGGTMRSGIVLGFAVAAFPKPMILPLLVWLVAWRPRAAAGASVTAVIAVALSVIAGGIDWWVAFAATLISGGGVGVDFVGNYGISRVSLTLWPIGAAIAAATFLWCLRRRGQTSSLAAATASGVFIAPYAGIYAALPIVLALPFIAVAAPNLAVIIALVGIVTAPWSPIVAFLVLIWAPTAFSDGGSQPDSRRVVGRAPPLDASR